MEMLLLPGMGLPRGEFTFFMRPDQSMQVIALADLGRINAEILMAPDRYSGKVIELAGASVTGKDLQDAFTKAAGRPIIYKRFSDELLAANPFLRRLAELQDSGLLAGAADLTGLAREFGRLASLEEWLGAPEKRYSTRRSIMTGPRWHCVSAVRRRCAPCDNVLLSTT
ncbi:hypothetical protein GR158_20480 [Shinella sp. AETb1-6]|uniref:NmrA family NAD(P)-binding protein n=1 Tax=Shinella sp. AETb1-6 TaxID=2692210 RepID=UPI00136F0C73|nr:NmrA family NAD(P)-binding protein [Shinella sp. AETb1-6]MXN53480.1 hypothetical protein [Shinella sp. AETb1-6]